jgi:hypothetical protein
MPFDGIPIKKRMRIPVRVIDKALELLGPNGENWAKGFMFQHGKFCMCGAIAKASEHMRLKGLRHEVAVGHLVEMALKEAHEEPVIEQFNDCKPRVFADIRNIMLAARQIAVERAPRMPPAVPFNTGILTTDQLEQIPEFLRRTH